MARTAFLICQLICTALLALGLSGCWSSGEGPQLQTPQRGPKTLYEIFTRSFQDSNGDGVGDLDGITSRLDYLSDLGVDGIWLTPIYPSPSYHEYDITDYEQVKSEYGDLSAVQKLVSAAHERGIQVLLDIAVNHTSIQNPWFKDHELYLWSAQPEDWPLGQGKWYSLDGQYYYASFGQTMPDLNWRNSEVLDRIERVFEFWTGLGVDGFRLDAAKFLVKGPQGEQNTPETHQIWKQIVGDVRAQSPDTYFVGEIWDSAQNIASYYGSGDELDAAFDFPVMGGLRSSLQSGNGDAFAQALEQRAKTQPTSTFAAPFVGSHDLERIASQLGGDTRKLKLAALAFLSLPGNAVVYYGDEIGMLNGSPSASPGDRAKRTPMQWDESANRGFSSGKPWTAISTTAPGASVAAQEQDPKSLWQTYQTLIQLRARDPDLVQGDLSEIQEPAPGVVSFVRSDDTWVILNFSGQDVQSLRIPTKITVNSDSALNKLYGEGSASADVGSIIASIPNHSGSLFSLKESPR